MGTRTSKSLMNIVFGIGFQFSLIITSFVTRTVFIHYLSKELLGINSLFTNILSILSLADLGFETAMLYSYYKPLAVKDELKLTSLTNYFKRIYIIISAVILFMGILLIPFLDFFLGNTPNIPNLTLYYLIFLVDICVSYLFASRTAIINADQKSFIIKKYSFILNLIKCLIQCLVLICFQNFLLYLLVQILYTAFLNILIVFKSRKMYPYISSKASLSKDEKRDIFKNVKSLIFYKFGGVIFANSDNIIMSILIGVVTVAIYSNYYTLINSVNSVITIVFTAISFSVGNLIASEQKNQQYAVFNKLNFFSFFILGISSVCLIILLNDFILLWIGKDFIVDMKIVIVMVINFYMQGILKPIWVYRDSAGLFKEVQFLPLFTSLLNIFFSIILGIKFGLFGVLLATIISRILSNFWYEPYLLIHNYFEGKFINYVKKLIKNIFITTVCIFIFSILNEFIFDNSWSSFILISIICSFGTLLIFTIFYIKDKDLLFFVSLIKKLWLNFKKSKKNEGKII